MEPTRIKQEPFSDIDDHDHPKPEGLLPNIELEIPDGFERNEWEELTEGFASEEQEVQHVLWQRGQGGSRKGRPTNLSVPHKGFLSSSARAVQQRDRAALRDNKSKAIEAANTADRAAKAQLKKRIEKEQEYLALSTSGQQQYRSQRQEELNQKRFDEKKSSEWLETTLARVHQKWAKIDNELATRRHKKTLAKLQGKSESSSSKEPESRAGIRVWGSGGVVEKVLRNIYQDGLANLTNNTFENKHAEEEWQAFVDGLTQEELAMVTDGQWQQRRLLPLPRLEEEGTAVDSNGRYVPGDDSDECEEEIDEDSEIDAMYNEGPNEYELESGDETDFEGFSD